MAKFGKEQLMLWRRSYDTPPPPLSPDNPWSSADDPRYRDLAPADIPRDRVPGRRGARGPCPTGSRPSCPTCAGRRRPTAPSWWSPTATASGPCASTWRASPTPPSPARDPDRHPVPDAAERRPHGALVRLPGRPGGGGRGSRRRGPPGWLTPPQRDVSPVRRASDRLIGSGVAARGYVRPTTGRLGLVRPPPGHCAGEPSAFAKSQYPQRSAPRRPRRTRKGAGGSGCLAAP